MRGKGNLPRRRARGELAGTRRCWASLVARAGGVGSWTPVMSKREARFLRLLDELRRIKCFWACDATCVGVRVVTKCLAMPRQSPRPRRSRPRRKRRCSSSVHATPFLRSFLNEFGEDSASAATTFLRAGAAGKAGFGAHPPGPRARARLGHRAIGRRRRKDEGVIYPHRASSGRRAPARGRCAASHLAAAAALRRGPSRSSSVPSASMHAEARISMSSTEVEHDDRPGPRRESSTGLTAGPACTGSHSKLGSARSPRPPRLAARATNSSEKTRQRGPVLDPPARPRLPRGNELGGGASDRPSRPPIRGCRGGNGDKVCE